MPAPAETARRARPLTLPGETPRTSGSPASRPAKLSKLKDDSHCTAHRGSNRRAPRGYRRKTPAKKREAPLCSGALRASARTIKPRGIAKRTQREFVTSNSVASFCVFYFQGKSANVSRCLFIYFYYVDVFVICSGRTQNKTLIIEEKKWNENMNFGLREEDSSKNSPYGEHFEESAFFFILTDFAFLPPPDVHQSFDKQKQNKKIGKYGLLFSALVDGSVTRATHA